MIWVFPTIVVAAGIDFALHNDFQFPLPFILVFVSVVVAGAFGGLLPGLLAGLVAAFEIFHSYRMGFGPPELTGGLLQTSLGSVVFVGVGCKLGWLRDRSNRLLAQLKQSEKELEYTLAIKSDEKDQEAAKVTEREEQLRQAMRLSGVGFFKWDVLSGNCEFCSEQHAAHFGMTPQEFQMQTSGPEPYVGYVHEDDRERFLQAVSRIDGGEALPFDYRIVRPNGDVRHLRQINEPVFDDAGVEISVVGSSIDFTELHEAEERVRRSQRIEVIGNLTGGVAHDFNNLLAIILGNLELTLETYDPQTRNKLLGEAIKATNRGADLTRSLLSFARRAHLTPTRLKLNPLVANTITWNSRVLPETIDIETSLFAGLWDTDLDAASTENAIINLLLNARDAMPDGGKLTVETVNMQIGQEYIGDREEDIQPGRYVMLAISDTGQGIAPDKLEQIFEPFYSEKPIGQGTGLGLSMVQGFIKQSNGAIRVYSEVGVGTTFKLYFKAAEGTIKIDELKSPEVTLTCNDGIRILLAEDEPGVIEILRNILEGAGHSVTPALSGDAALEIFKTGGPFDLLLTDIVMPGNLQGPSLAKAIRAIAPDIPCVFLSGYAAEATVHGNGLRPSDVRLMKPTSRETLLAAISKASSN